MKRFTLVAASLAAVVASLVPGTTAQAADYSDPTLSIQIPGGKIYGGDTVTITAKASVTCKPIAISLLGQRPSANGSSITHTFSTPVVKKVTTVTATVTCSYTGATGSATKATDAESVTPAAYAPSLVGPLAGDVASTSAKVVLLPRDAASAGQESGSGLLPDTGGPAFWLLIAGVVLVLAGGVTVLRRRRP